MLFSEPQAEPAADATQQRAPIAPRARSAEAEDSGPVHISHVLHEMMRTYDSGAAAPALPPLPPLADEHDGGNRRSKREPRFTAEGTPRFTVLDGPERIKIVARLLQERGGIFINERGGLKCYRGAEDESRRKEALAQLEGVFYHFPFQTLHFVFRTLPRLEFEHSRCGKSIISPQAAVRSISKWLERHPHTQQEVAAWIRHVSAYAERLRSEHTAWGGKLKLPTNALNACRHLAQALADIWQADSHR